MRLMPSLMTTALFASVLLVGCASGGSVPKRPSGAEEKNALSRNDRCALQQSRGEVSDVDCPPSTYQQRQRRMPGQDGLVRPELPGLGLPTGDSVLRR